MYISQGLKISVHLNTAYGCKIQNMQLWSAVDIPDKTWKTNMWSGTIHDLELYILLKPCYMWYYSIWRKGVLGHSCGTIYPLIRPTGHRPNHIKSEWSSSPLTFENIIENNILIILLLKNSFYALMFEKGLSRIIIMQEHKSR